MLIILMVMFLLALAVGFVIFLGVLLTATTSLWGLWVGIRGRPLDAASAGKDELIILLTMLLLAVLGSPFLFGGLLYVWAIW